MARQAIAVLDFGTTSVKAVLIDAHSGGLLAVGRGGYPLLHPREGYIEAEPEQIWQASQKALREACNEAGAEIGGLTFTFFGHSMLLVDKKYQPVQNLILVADSRGAPMMEQAEREHGALYERIRGEVLKDTYAPLKVKWMRQHMPEVCEKAAYLFDIQLYILTKLGLPPISDDSMAACKCLLDIQKRIYSPELMDAFDVPRAWLAHEIADSDTVAGHVTHYGEVPLGGSVPVVIGAHDAECALLGVGAIPENKGLLGDSMGTYHQIGFLQNDKPGWQAPAHMHASLRGRGAEYYAFYFAYHGGGAVNWFMDTFFEQPDTAKLEALFAQCAYDGSNPSMFDSYLSRGLGNIDGISLTRTRGQLFEALTEGILFEVELRVRNIRAAMREQQGIEPERLRTMGGASRAEGWLQLRASLLDLPVEQCAHTEGTAAGAAALAMVGAGMCSDFKQATDQLVNVKQTFYPDPVQREAYAEKMQRYAKRVEERA